MAKGMQYVPWFHGDFLRSTQGWTLEERAVYWMLLCAQWEMGALPADESRIASIVGIGNPDEFMLRWKVVGPKFEKTEAGLQNARMEEHRQQYLAYREKLSQGGRKGMKTRWPKKDTAPSAPQERPAYEAEEFHNQVIASYHDCCPTLPAVKGWTEARAADLNARIRERLAAGKNADTPEYWGGLFTQLAATPFLCGRGEGSNGWTASLPWLIETEERFLQVIEGRYDPRDKGRGHHGVVV